MHMYVFQQPLDGRVCVLEYQSNAFPNVTCAFKYDKLKDSMRQYKQMGDTTERYATFSKIVASKLGKREK